MPRKILAAETAHSCGRSIAGALAGYSFPLVAIITYCPTSAYAQPRASVQDILVSSILVLDEIDRGVRAEIRIEKSDGELFAETDEDGKATPNKKCPAGKVLWVVPKVRNLYLHQLPVLCKPTLRFILRKAEIALRLYIEGVRAAMQNRHEVSQMLFFESSERLEQLGEPVSVLVKAEGYKSFFSAFPPGKTYYIIDAGQKQAVPTKEGELAISIFKKSHGLPENGLLDYRTQAVMANRDIAGLIKKAYSADRAVIEEFRFLPKSVSVPSELEGLIGKYQSEEVEVKPPNK